MLKHASFLLLLATFSLRAEDVAVVTPEPASFLMLASGAGALFLVHRYTRKKKQ